MIHKFVKRLFAYQGKLYTWGSSANYLGHSESVAKTAQSFPVELEGFEAGSISKVAMGNNHGAIVTKDGLIYTFGRGDYGALGHDSEAKKQTPTLIESLAKIDIKVADVAIGDHHTVLLTAEGDVWTMGYGGRLAGGWWRKMFSQGGGGLGHGDLENKFVPTPVENLKERDDIVQISAGSYHSMALGKSGLLYAWGKGEYGVLGMGSNRNYLAPHVNHFFENIQRVEGVEIKKIQSCHFHSSVLLEDGRAYTWGRNDEGQLAIGSSIGIDMYESQRHPTLLEHDLEGKKIKDMELGESISIYLTEDNEVYVAGLKLWWEPFKLMTPPDVHITEIFTGDRYAGFVNDHRDVYFVGKMFGSKDVDEILNLRIWKAKEKNFKGKIIEAIGGSYKNHYCILNEPSVESK